MDLNSVDWGASGRRDTFSLSLVDPFTLRETGSADFIPSESSVMWAADTESIAEAEIALVGDFRQDANERLLRLHHHVEVGGVEVDETLGTYFVDDVSRKSRDGLLRRTLTCYSTLWRLSQDYLADDYLAASGANALAACSRLVTYAGGVMRTDTGIDPGATLISDELHQIGENRLATLRTVAGNRDWRVGVDEDGRVTLTPYSEPLTRARKYDFADGRDGVCLVGLSMSATRTKAVNRVVAWWSRETLPDPDDGTASWGYMGRYVADLDPGSAFSYERCGRRRTHVMQIGEPCSPAALKARAESYLAENSGDQTDIVVSHPQIPGLHIGDVVTYQNSVDEPDPLALTCEVTQMSARLRPGMVCETKMRILSWEARR